MRRLQVVGQNPPPKAGRRRSKFSWRVAKGHFITAGRPDRSRTAENGSGWRLGSSVFNETVKRINGALGRVVHGMTII